MAASRIGFVTGIESVWRHHLVAAKQGVHHLSGGLTPDVYALPRFLGNSRTFIRTGKSIDRGAFDLIFSELNAGDAQLAFLESLVAAQPPPVAILPGPPEILTRRLSDERLRAVRQSCAARPRARLCAGTRTLLRRVDRRAARAGRALAVRLRGSPRPGQRACGPAGPHGCDPCLLNVPLRFTGVAQNHPFVLKAALLDAIAPLPAADRERLRFHRFVYEDVTAKPSTRRASPTGCRSPSSHGGPMAHSFVPRLLRRRRQHHRLERVGPGHLSRGRARQAGAVSANAHLNTELYPSATVPQLKPETLRDGLSGLIRGVLAGRRRRRSCQTNAARRVGDFAANAATFRRLVFES